MREINCKFRLKHLQKISIDFRECRQRRHNIWISTQTSEQMADDKQHEDHEASVTMKI